MSRPRRPMELPSKSTKADPHQIILGVNGQNKVIKKRKSNKTKADRKDKEDRRIKGPKKDRRMSESFPYKQN